MSFAIVISHWFYYLFESISLKNVFSLVNRGRYLLLNNQSQYLCCFVYMCSLTSSLESPSFSPLLKNFLMADSFQPPHAFYEQSTWQWRRYLSIIFPRLKCTYPAYVLWIYIVFVNTVENLKVKRKLRHKRLIHWKTY